MNSARLDDMVKGWFVGGFSPTAFATDACEVAVKSYKAGDSEAAHYHKRATEITLVLQGRVRMAGREWSAGDIIVLAPGEITDFEALTDAVNVVVKTPGALDDKFPA
jgi:quercetin dioxygenase-like cupin family protein